MGVMVLLQLYYASAVFYRTGLYIRRGGLRSTCTFQLERLLAVRRSQDFDGFHIVKLQLEEF